MAYRQRVRMPEGLESRFATGHKWRDIGVGESGTGGKRGISDGGDCGESGRSISGGRHFPAVELGSRSGTGVQVGR